MTLAMIREACKWTTKLHDDGSREFFDATGKRRARTHDDNVLAIHFMFACNESDRLRAEIDRLQATDVPALVDAEWLDTLSQRQPVADGFVWALGYGDTGRSCYVKWATLPNGEFWAIYYGNVKLQMLVDRSEVITFCKLLGVPLANKAADAAET